MKRFNIDQSRKLFNDIESIIKKNLPYYEAEDKDEYIYLAKRQHVKSLTMRIIEYLDKRKEL